MSGVRVLVPYVANPALPVVRTNLQYQRTDVTFVRMTDALHYARLVSAWWNAPFVLVEHDILPWPGALAAMWECPEPWCRYAYPLGPEPIIEAYLGCVKFDPATLGPIEIDGTSWREMDGAVENALRARGFTPHQHEPPVIHLGAEAWEVE